MVFVACGYGYSVFYFLFFIYLVDHRLLFSIFNNIQIISNAHEYKKNTKKVLGNDKLRKHTSLNLDSSHATKLHNKIIYGFYATPEVSRL